MQKVIQFGIPRSGTTVLYLILKSLPGFEVKKIHNFKPGAGYDKVVIALRDFRDVFVSFYRTEQEKRLATLSREIDITEASLIVNAKGPKIPAISAATIRHWSKLMDNQVAKLNSYKEYYKDKALWLTYEKFWNDFEYIYDSYEEFFNITIAHELRKELTDKYNIQSVKNIANKMRDFNEWDSKTRVHGNHILNGTPGYWKQCVPQKHHKLLNDLFANNLTKWGYEI